VGIEGPKGDTSGGKVGEEEEDENGEEDDGGLEGPAVEAPAEESGSGSGEDDTGLQAKRDGGVESSDEEGLQAKGDEAAERAGEEKRGGGQEGGPGAAPTEDSDEKSSTLPPQGRASQGERLLLEML
jgi:hypothetical protein